MVTPKTSLLNGANVRLPTGLKPIARAIVAGRRALESGLTDGQAGRGAPYLVTPKASVWPIVMCQFGPSCKGSTSPLG